MNMSELEYLKSNDKFSIQDIFFICLYISPKRFKKEIQRSEQLSKSASIDDIEGINTILNLVISNSDNSDWIKSIPAIETLTPLQINAAFEIAKSLEMDCKRGYLENTPDASNAYQFYLAREDIYRWFTERGLNSPDLFIPLNKNRQMEKAGHPHAVLRQDKPNIELLALRDWLTLKEVHCYLESKLDAEFSLEDLLTLFNQEILALTINIPSGVRIYASNSSYNHSERDRVEYYAKEEFKLTLNRVVDKDKAELYSKILDLDRNESQKRTEKFNISIPYCSVAEPEAIHVFCSKPLNNDDISFENGSELNHYADTFVANAGTCTVFGLVGTNYKASISDFGCFRKSVDGVIKQLQSDSSTEGPKNRGTSFNTQQIEAIHRLMEKLLKGAEWSRGELSFTPSLLICSKEMLLDALLEDSDMKVFFTNKKSKTPLALDSFRTYWKNTPEIKDSYQFAGIKEIKNCPEDFIPKLLHSFRINKPLDHHL